MAVMLIASFAFTMINVPKAYAIAVFKVVNPNTGLSEFPNMNPGDSFSARVDITGALGVRAFEFTLSWNTAILRLDPLNPVEEGGWLRGPWVDEIPLGPSPNDHWTRNTYFVYSIGVDQGSITVANLVTTYNTASGSGTLAILHLNVIGGGQTNLALSGLKLQNVNFNNIPVGPVVNGHFWSQFPFIDYAWFVPQGYIVPGSDNVSVYGVTRIPYTDASGNPAYGTGPTYYLDRPTITIDPETGIPVSNAIVKYGTIWYGDQVRFDASGSYDLNSSGLPSVGGLTYKWIIRAGGVDTIANRDSRYESAFNYAAGTTVAVGDSDEVLNGFALRLFATKERHAENILANGKYDVGEFIYMDADNSNTTSIGDTRLTKVGAYAAGTVVVSGDTDIGTVLVPFNANERYVDLAIEKPKVRTLNSKYDPGEFIYRDVDGSRAVSAGDLRLIQVAGGGEFPSTAIFNYVFPGDLPYMYGRYNGAHLGWHDLFLEVTDAEGHKATYYTWVRIWRLVPTKTVQMHIADKTHSLSKDGPTMLLGGKIQNRGGLGGVVGFPWTALQSYLDLARIPHAYVWARMQFDIYDISGDLKDTVYSDAVWLYATENEVNPMNALWTINVPAGEYDVEMTAFICGNGYTFGLAATGTISQSISITT